MSCVSVKVISIVLISQTCTSGDTESGRINESHFGGVLLKSVFRAANQFQSLKLWDHA